MLPRSFSATAIQTAELCMARYFEENVQYSKGMGGVAASLGSSVHGALEMYVKSVYLNKTDQPSIKLLLDYFRMSFMTTFGTADPSGEEFDEGVEMLKDWFKRTKIEDGQVISAEIKTNFPIKVNHNGQVIEIPFNYIWDRFDKTGEHEYTVVDYKTNRWGLSPGDLKKKVQARVYGLAAQIQQPDAERIWVQFDMLRHGGPVGIVFSREENAETWRFLKRKAQEIIDTDPSTVRESLNPECLFCVRKQSCKALKSNISSGGIFTIGSVQEGIDHRAQLEFQKKAVDAALKELDAHLLNMAREDDGMEYESDQNVLTVGVYKRREVDPDMAERVIGEALMKKYGGRKFSITTVEKLLKGDELNAEQKKQLRGLIQIKTGEPSVKISPKSVIDGS